MTAGNHRELQEMRVAFRLARLIGEELVRDHKISWKSFSLFMIAFEKELKRMGDEI